MASITYTLPDEGTVELKGNSEFVLAAHVRLVDWALSRAVDREVAKGRDRDEVLREMHAQVQSELARIEREGPNENATATIGV